jgi:hypothetical protein
VLQVAPQQGGSRSRAKRAVRVAVRRCVAKLVRGRSDSRAFEDLATHPPFGNVIQDVFILHVPVGAEEDRPGVAVYRFQEASEQNYWRDDLFRPTWEHLHHWCGADAAMGR